MEKSRKKTAMAMILILQKDKLVFIETRNTDISNTIGDKISDMQRYWHGDLPEPSVRTLDELECVLANPDYNKSGINTNFTNNYESFSNSGFGSKKPMYYMYRDLAQNDADRRKLREKNLRYDITVIPAAKIDSEYVKTKGHYHPKAPCGLSYPELYQVLGGEGIFLLQKKDLSDIVAVSAGTGEIVFIPPDYGHITINPSNETLVMANIVSSAFSSDYQFYEQMKGGTHYLIDNLNDNRNDENDNEQPIWLPNPNYINNSGNQSGNQKTEDYQYNSSHKQRLDHVSTQKFQKNYCQNLQKEFQNVNSIYNYAIDSYDLDFMNDPRQFFAHIR